MRHEKGTARRALQLPVDLSHNFTNVAETLRQRAARQAPFYLRLHRHGKRDRVAAFLAAPQFHAGNADSVDAENGSDRATTRERRFLQEK